MAIHDLKLFTYQLADNNQAISRRRMSAREQTGFWSPSALLSDDNVRLQPECLIAVGCVVLERGPLKGDSRLQVGFIQFPKSVLS